MIDGYDFYEESEEYKEYTPDAYFEKAQAEIRKLYEDNKDSVFYLRQLQVKFEKQYFHWVTNNALVGLLKIGYLKDYRIEREEGTSTRFFYHRSNRYPVRAARKLEEIVQAYSQDHITRGCGHRAEDLFCKALALRGFRPVGTRIKNFEGKTWRETGHDLDFVFNRDGINYGCEIKNTLGYIDKEELETKLRMCSFLNLRPLFIMRYAPKTYNQLIYSKGGFALIFETQIYELGQVELVKKIKDIVGLPVICTSAIPDGIIDRFEKWHQTKIV